MPAAISNNSKLLAAIDLGSNSFHMVQANIENNQLVILQRTGEKVQLAAGLDSNLMLDEESMQRGLDCLANFAQSIPKLEKTALRVVGTSTLRNARNREEFIRRAQAILGHEIDVISGREEARLIYLGISHSLPANKQLRLAIDIGGGSTEFIVGQNFESLFRGSLQMGCVRFTKRFFPDDKLSAASYQQAYTAARLELMEIQQLVKSMEWQQVVGASGTLKSVAQACAAAGYGQGEINRAGINHLKQQLLRLSLLEQVSFAGVKPERASIFPAGLAIVEAIFDALELDKLEPASGALREGVLYDLLERQQQQDIRDRTVAALMQRYRVTTTQTQPIENLAGSLFHQLAGKWQLTEQRHLQLLSWAARLHPIGLDIAHYHYHKHGAYIVEHSDLAGFSRQEQQQLAFLVRSHRRNIPTELPVPDISSLQYLIVILRLAILLNHLGNFQAMPELEFQPNEQALTVVFPSQWLAQNPLMAAEFHKETQWLERANFSLLLVEK